ncbi:flavin monoamine oxidase family protein [Halomonas ramblicola]|uniref:flavin monoamine oxidase family protein n=1 Tax=Halomonas ramblicola TaxID=747349 RepID=UPI0025B325ED|nr:NAD(P)/FAD-dependent oxidoreductase [Halomonas ramblicola]MDN3522931.1 FAD-dependent oxidoreductase [Halomonas ramblicola]
MMTNTLNRRAFLKSSSAMVAGGVAAGTLGFSSSAQSAEDDGTYDVIVVGSGFAGVTAARNASQAGLKVLHLEASSRLGGRCFTSHFAGHDIDLGGTWIGWGQPHVWAEKMRYQIPITESAAFSASQYVWYPEPGHRRGGSPDDYWKVMYEANEAYFAPAREALPRPYSPLFVPDDKGLDRLTAKEAIEQLDVSAEQKVLLNGFAAINGHSPTDTSSYLDQLRWIALAGFNQFFMWDNLGRFRFEGGTKSLLTKMHEDSKAEFKTGQPVKSVEQTDDHVQVTTVRNETYVGRKLILAVPLNVISTIEYTPAISNTKMEISRQRHTGSGVKLYARIKGKHPLMFGHGTQDMPLTFVWTEYDDEDSQILVGFGASPELLDTTDAVAVQEAVNQYLPDAEVIDFVSYDWNVDPYSLGTWCMYRPGWLTESFEELQQAEGNIHFATADIASGWRGFIDGAIESGALAAEQVAELLKEGASA